MPRAALTGVELVKPDEIVCTDIGPPPRECESHSTLSAQYADELRGSSTMTPSSREPTSPKEGDSSHGVVPIGRQRLAVSRSFAAAYEQSPEPVIVADRVWFARAGDRLLLHVGRRVVVDMREP
jgi:hypothetical protein